MIAVLGFLLAQSIDGFFHYRALIPQATDPTDGIGYKMIMSAGVSVAAGGAILGILSTFFTRTGRVTESDPSRF